MWEMGEEAEGNIWPTQNFGPPMVTWLSDLNNFSTGKTEIIPIKVCYTTNINNISISLSSHVQQADNCTGSLKVYLHCESKKSPPP